MKVYNLTDVSTKPLEQRGLLNQHIAVSTRMVAPGEFVEVADSPTSRYKLEYLVKVGALSIDALPPAYVSARQALAAQTSRLGVLSQRHLAVSETKVATEPLTKVVLATAVPVVAEASVPLKPSEAASVPEATDLAEEPLPAEQPLESVLEPATSVKSKNRKGK